jgi:hypothetical protein
MINAKKLLKDLIMIRTFISEETARHLLNAINQSPWAPYIFNISNNEVERLTHPPRNLAGPLLYNLYHPSLFPRPWVMG